MDEEYSTDKILIKNRMELWVGGLPMDPAARARRRASGFT
eukprot:SAG31_NODE_21616_length_545_cov_0.932735_2_plen_40_part_01